jgi:hypothetical protein
MAYRFTFNFQDIWITYSIGCNALESRYKALLVPKAQST